MKHETYMTKKEWNKFADKYRLNPKPESDYLVNDLNLVGLAGPKGVGKTTFAKRVLKGKVHSLATPIKNMLATLLPKRYLYEDKETPIPGWPDKISGRILLQRVGTECFRKMWPDIWVTHLLDAIKEQGPYLCVIDDVRFPNEAIAIQKRGGQIWRLSRSGVSPVDSHVSEAGLPDHLVDREINLDGEA